MESLAATEMVEAVVVPVQPVKLLELRLVLSIKAVMVVLVQRHQYQVLL
jgi:hypothetical protein